MGAVAEFKCPPGHVYRQDTAERYVESKETSKSVDVTCEVQEGFPQWVTSHERDTLKPCRKGNRLFMCQDENENEPKDKSIKPVMNEPGLSTTIHGGYLTGDNLHEFYRLHN